MPNCAKFEVNRNNLDQAWNDNLVQSFGSFQAHLQIHLSLKHKEKLIKHKTNLIVTLFM